MDISSALRTAGNGLTDVKNRALTAARGLRMPGVGGMPAAVSNAASSVMASPRVGQAVNAVMGAPAAVSDAVKAAPAAISDAASSAMGSMRSAATTVGDAASSAAQSMRTPAASVAPAPGVPPIPTLTDVVKPGGPFVKPPDIPVLTDVLHSPPAANPITNPNFATGMSPEARAAGFGSASVPRPPAGFVAPAETAAETAAPAAETAAQGSRLGGAMRVLGKAAGIGGVGLGAYEAARGVQEGDMGKAGLGAADAAASAAMFTPAAPAAGVYLAGRGGMAAGKMISDALPENVQDAIGGTINQGLRALAPIAHRAGEIIVGKSGPFSAGPANWGDGWGTDDSAYLAQKAAAGGGAGAGGKPPVPPAGAAPAAPAGDPADIAAFNKRMTEIGATGVGMRAGATPDSRVIGSTGEASKEAQAATAQNMADRTSQLAAADASNARMEERRQALARLDGIANERFDESAQGRRSANDLTAAMQPRIGASPVGTPGQVLADRAASQKDFETSKTLRAQGSVQMRGQDTTSDDARLTQQTALINGMRTQQQANRTYNLEAAKFDQAKDQNDEKVLHERTEQVNKQVASMIAPTGDPVKDQARAAQYQQALPAYVASIKAGLQERLKKNPGDKLAASALAGYEKHGVGHLDENDLEKFTAGMEFNDKAQEYGSVALNPVGGRASMRSGPATAIQLKHNLLTGNVYVDGSGAEVPQRAIDGDGSFIGGLRNTRFKSIITPEKK